jgi:anthranilate phosphoribosyltransferase
VLEPLTQQLATGVGLSEEQAGSAVDDLIDESTTAETKAAFLATLARKGETVSEIAAFARGLRDKSIRPALDSDSA